MAAMTSQSHLWRNCRGCLEDVSNKDLAIIENNQFTNLIEVNWIVISIEIQLMKSAYWMAKIITLSVFKSFKQQSLFRSNLARLKDGGTSPSVVVAG